VRESKSRPAAGSVDSCTGPSSRRRTWSPNAPHRLQRRSPRPRTGVRSSCALGPCVVPVRRRKKAPKALSILADALIVVSSIRSPRTPMMIAPAFSRRVLAAPLLLLPAAPQYLCLVFGARRASCCLLQISTRGHFPPCAALLRLPAHSPWRASVQQLTSSRGSRKPRSGLSMADAQSSPSHGKRRAPCSAM